MSGSRLGWIFPQDTSKFEAAESIYRVLNESSDARHEGEWDHNGDYYRIKSGQTIRSFCFRHDPTADCWLVFENQRVFFRPLDLGYIYTSPDHCYQDATQEAYDFSKRVFDISRAIECFGFESKQSNAYAFRDSNIDFFFLKSGPQLVLRNLEERRAPSKADMETFSTDEPEYESRGMHEWDLELNSIYFTRFSEKYEDRIVRVYNGANELIRKSWKEYLEGR